MATRKQITGGAISTVAAREHFSDLINRVAYGKDRVVLTRRNRPLAAVVPFEDMALLEEIEDREDLKAAQRRCARSNAREQSLSMKYSRSLESDAKGN